jgi:hypothetical protein
MDRRLIAALPRTRFLAHENPIIVDGEHTTSTVELDQVLLFVAGTM